MTAPYGLLDPNQMLQQSLQQGLLGPEMTSAPAAPAAPPTLRQRVLGGARAALDRVRETLAPTPAGYEGLLSDEDMQAARPNLLQMIVGRERPDGSVAGSYRDNLNQVLAGRTAAAGLQAQRALMQRRAEIGQMFPADPNEAMPQTVARLNRMYQAYAAAGDVEMVQKMGEVLKSYGYDENGQPALKEVRLGDRVNLVNPGTGEVVQSYKVGQEPGSGQTPAQKLEADRALRRAQADREHQLVQEYRANKGVQNAEVVAQSVATIRALMARNSPQADLGIIIALTKAYDPGSVAREGEVKLTTGAAEAFDRLKIFVDQWNQGRKLTPQMRVQVAELVDELIAMQQERMRPIRDSYRRRVERYNQGMPSSALLDYETIAPDLFGAFTDPLSRVLDKTGTAPSLLGPPAGARSGGAAPANPLMQPEGLL